MQLKIRQKSLVKPEVAFLREFRRDVTSQRGEDGMIEKIFELIGVTNQYCIEFGAWDGKLNSNTWNLLKNNSWKGLLIEASEWKFEELKTEYADKEDVTLVRGLVETEGENSLDALLARAGAPREPDFLSIDIDGMDWHIWNSVTEFAPRLVVVEFNPTIPNDTVFVQDDDASVSHGSSLLALVDLGKSKGYELIATTVFNGFFIKKELSPLIGIEDNDIDAMHDNSYFESRLFQLYDGTLVLGGCKRLLWQNIEISQEDIQILPEALRKYGDTQS